MRRKGKFIFVVCFLCCLCLSGLVYSQPMEEEEEPVQARPNPVADKMMMPIEPNGSNAAVATEIVSDEGEHGGSQVSADPGDGPGGHRVSADPGDGPGGHRVMQEHMERQERMIERKRVPAGN